MQRLEVSGAVWPIYGSLGFKPLNTDWHHIFDAQTQVSAQGSAILMKSFDYVPQSLQQNDGIVLRL